MAVGSSLDPNNKPGEALFHASMGQPRDQLAQEWTGPDKSVIRNEFRLLTPGV